MWAVLPWRSCSDTARAIRFWPPWYSSPIMAVLSRLSCFLWWFSSSHVRLVSSLILWLSCSCWSCSGWSYPGWSCSGCAILAILVFNGFLCWLSILPVLSVWSCSSYPFPTVLFMLSCSVVLFLVSCSGWPLLTVLLQLSYAVQFWQSI
jgi:hypothetical protein